MELRFCVLLTDLSAALLNRAHLNLTTGKSIFVEDEPVEWQALYSALEFITLPDFIESPRADSLFIGWDTTFDPEVMRLIVDSLHDAGLTPAIMLLHYEDGSVIRVESLEEEDWYQDKALSPLGCSMQGVDAVTSLALACVSKASASHSNQ
ncbi:hypothetical protein [Pseudomonas solani]|uniref:hypothetical protein n=1 Tax=Pseudomonas solani TaxID=2731552 RepID=UPI003D6B9BD8